MDVFLFIAGRGAVVGCFQGRLKFSEINLSVYSAALELNKLLLNRRDTEYTERKN